MSNCSQRGSSYTLALKVPCYEKQNRQMVESNVKGFHEEVTSNRDVIRDGDNGHDGQPAGQNHSQRADRVEDYQHNHTA